MSKFREYKVVFKEYKRICILVELSKRVDAAPVYEIKLEVPMLAMTHIEPPQIFLLHVVLMSTFIICI